MTHADVLLLIRNHDHLMSDARLVETHISWVILSQNMVLKIKKPVQFSFLDFSTLKKRKYFCERELVLNQRLASGIYEEVIPIRLKENQYLSLESENGTIVDYALKMKYLDSSRQMDVLLKNNLVNRQHIEQLATQLANFHMSTEVIIAHPDLKLMQADFADILKVKSVIEEYWGEEAASCLEQGVEYSARFLNTHSSRIYERHLDGFTVDGHGDLHAKNIFLLEDPVIFDCIEFNDHLRQLDVLNELAFLCMDLDFYQRQDLSDDLIRQYNEKHVCIYNHSDEKLFHYYKLYRANVRLKISALDIMQTTRQAVLDEQLFTIKTYLELFKTYLV